MAIKTAIRRSMLVPHIPPMKYCSLTNVSKKPKGHYRIDNADNIGHKTWNEEKKQNKRKKKQTNKQTNNKKNPKTNHNKLK